MVIQHKQVDKKGLFYVGQEGAIAAELAYSINHAGNMVIEHTEVDESLKGKHVGHELVETAVNYARNQGIKIIPICPFARSLFLKKKEWEDVLYKEAKSST
ncbi:MAG: GNAT family N-acetyltransferase [Bacteroidetes bacterium]|nr:MAG: GNAT family N-acetyltransferase [Bacteroidota bacterium]